LSKATTWTAVLTASLVALAARPSAAQTISVVGATEKVYENDTSLPGPTTSATLYAARNEFEGFQVVIQGPSSGISITPDVLRGPGGYQIVPSSYHVQGNIMIYRELFSSLPPPNKSATDSAAKEGNAPDALVPQYDEFYQEQRNTAISSIVLGQNAVYFIDIHVPDDATPGVYTGRIIVNHDGTSTPVSVNLTVWPFKLESTSHLPTSYGFGWNPVSSQYPLLRGASGTPTLAEAHVRHAIMGLNHRITIMVMDYGASFVGLSGRTLYHDQFRALINGQVNTLLAGARPTSLAYQGADDRSELGDWRDFFNSPSNGWGNLLYDYADEPGVITTWCDLYNRSNAAAAAGVRMMTTTTIANVRDTTHHNCSNSAIDENKISVFIPNVTQVQDGSMGTGQNSLGQYSSWKTAGKEIWEYQSCNSWGCGGRTPTGYPSTATDHSAIRARAMEWITFRNGLTGELYWNAVYSWLPQHPPLDPWTDQNYSYGNGDGTLLFPGVASSSRVGGDHDIPLASLRLKMIREGMEDYEYMYILGTLGDASYANSQIDSVFSTAHSVTGVNPSTLYAARQNLACKIIQDQHPTWSCTDPGTWGTDASPMLTVSFAGAGAGTITSTPPGISCRSDGGTTCQASFPSGTLVTLNATADAGSTFSGYTGDCTGTSCTLTMSASKSVMASFTKPCSGSDCFNRADSPNLGSNWNTYQPALQVLNGQATNSDANGKAAQWLTSIGPDQDVAVDCKVTGSGSNCGLMARWTDANNHYYAYLDAGLASVDLWRVQGGTLTSLGSAARTISVGIFYHLRLLAQGTSISLYFNNEGTPAISVTDTALTTGNYGGLHAFALAAQTVWYSSFDIKVPSPPSLNATVTKSGTGAGTVTSTPAGINCGNSCSAPFSAGTVVTVTAAPASGSSFVGFSGGCTSSTASCTFTITANTIVDAAFTINDFAIAASPSSNFAQQGGSASYAISTTVTSGAAQTVSFSASGFPTGATASFSPPSVTAGGGSTMTIAVGSSTPPGPYTISVIGTGSSTTHGTSVTLQVTAPAVPVASLTDSFAGPIDSTKWTVSATAGTASASGGILTLTPNAGTSSAAVYVTSVGTYTLYNSQASSKVLGVVDSGGNINNKFTLRASGNQNELGWLYESGTLYAYYRVNGVETDTASLSYSASSHAYWRVRQSGSSIYWETSPDGVTYTVQASTLTSNVPFSLDTIQVEFNLKAFGTGAATAAPAKYYNLNRTPALVSSVTDPFTGPIDSTKWTVSATAGTATASGGILTLSPNAGPSAAIYVTSVGSYSLNGSQTSTKVVAVVDPGGNINNKFIVRAPGNQNELGWQYEHGILYAYYRVNGVETDPGQVTYSAATHAYWRVRQSGTSVYWETSPDGVNYTVQASVVTGNIPFPLDAVQLEFNVKAFGAATAAPAKYSNLNQ